MKTEVKPVMNASIATVTALAFVMPVYDHDSLNAGKFLYIPTEEPHAVDYWVYRWDYKKQAWVREGLYELYEDAVKAATELHLKLCRQHEIFP